MRWEDASDEDRLMSEAKHAEALAMQQVGASYGKGGGQQSAAPKSSKPITATMTDKEKDALVNSMRKESMPM